MNGTPRKTPLHGTHLRRGGKMVAFAGFELPLHYPGGIREEHRAVRQVAGLFDVSHMGEFEIRGPDALALVQHLTANDASALEPGRAQYSLLLNDRGGIIDDLLVYRLAQGAFLLVVNAANRVKDRDWILSRGGNFDAELSDRSDDYALLALQGPRADEVLAPLTDVHLGGLPGFAFARGHVLGVDALIARTGYTGEDGFELYVSAPRAEELWDGILDAGSGIGTVPAGLGARDALRLEMGYALYGSDLDEEHSALEAGLGWVVKPGKGEFVGRRALAVERERGSLRRLAGIRLAERGFPRPGHEVVSDGHVVGVVTSGTVSPCLRAGIALAYLPIALTSPGSRLALRVRGRDLAGEVVRLPFYRGGSRKR